MSIDAISIGPAPDDQLTITMRGSTESVIKVLVHGLKRESLLQLNDALTSELALRRAANNPTPGR